MTPKRGAITLVFDDGYTPVFDQVVPLLNQYHIPAVFAMPINHQSLSQESGCPITPWQKWLPLTSQGHEIAAHSLNHTDLTTLNNAQLESELKDPAQLLHASTLIYPGGAYDDRVKKYTQKYYKYARTTAKGFAAIPPPDSYALPTYNFTKHNFSPPKANLLAAYTWLTNSWLIETYHLVDKHPSSMLHSVQLKDFAKHLAFINRLPITITTIKNIVNRI